MKKYLPLWIGVFTACIAAYASAATARHPSPELLPHTSDTQYHLKMVARGIDVPWGIVMLPNHALLVSERSGTMWHIAQNGTKTAIQGVPEVFARGQGGLLDIELHPNFVQNRHIYFAYSSDDAKSNGRNTIIMRAAYHRHALTQQKIIYAATPESKTAHHFGSRIVFDRHGYLFFSIGDRGYRDTLPQNNQVDSGKIYRLHSDGRIPQDNPFAKGGTPAIFSYGHRNPQGLAIHPVTGMLWEHEHGPRGGDELNIIRKGRNYGWPVVSFGINYTGTSFTNLTHKRGMEAPIWHWTPSIAPSGMAFVTSDFYPQWQGHLLVGSLKFEHLVLVRLKGKRVISHHHLFPHAGRVREVIQGLDGYIYLGIDDKGVMRIVPKKP